MDFGDITLWFCLNWMTIFLVSLRGFQYIGDVCRRRTGNTGGGHEGSGTRRRQKSIPYAPRVPFLGSLPFIRQQPAQKIAKWYREKNLGSIFRVGFGSLDAVILNDYASIKECFIRKSHCFSGRHQSKPVVDLWKGDGLLFLDYGGKWESQSKFCHEMFRKIFQNGDLLQMTIDESREMAQALKIQLRGEGVVDGHASGNYRSEIMNCKKNKCNCAFHEAVDCEWNCLNPSNFVNQASSNLMCRILFGRSFHRSETEYCNVLKETPIQGRKSSAAFATAFLIPLLRHVPPIRRIINEALELRWATFKMIREIVENHVTQFERIHDKSDFIDVFIDRIVNKQGKNDDHFFTYSQVHALVFDIFTTGSQTFAPTLSWTILYLAKNRELQSDLRCEIKELLSESEAKNMGNLFRLQLTRATIHEVIRLHPIAPLGVARKVTTDCEVSGYKFAKGTVVMANIWSVHHDGNDFPEPETFNPRRHINESGEFTPHMHVIGFSNGGRQCPGKSITELHMLCALVQLLKNFEFRLPTVWNPRLESYEIASFDFSGATGAVGLPPEYWLQWKVISEAE